jgi:hypothetical protein
MTNEDSQRLIAVQQQAEKIARALNAKLVLIIADAESQLQTLRTVQAVVESLVNNGAEA